MLNFPFAIDTEALGVSEASLSAFFFVFSAFAAIFLIFALAFYILRAVGVYKMASGLEIKHSYLAFVPVANSYIFGRTAEKYNGKKSDGKTKYGTVLLTLRIIGIAIFIAASVTFTATAAKILSLAFAAYENDTELAIESLGGMVLPIVLFAVFALVSLAFVIVRYFALWRVYMLFDSSNAAAFTVISVLFNFIDPILIFILRNRKAEISDNDYSGNSL